MNRSNADGRAVCDFSIREEQRGDEDAIGLLVEGAFSSAAVAQLVDAIRRSPGFMPRLSLVATVGDRIVGHVMVSAAELRDGTTTRRIATLSPLAVAPGFRRRSIGSTLVREVTARADGCGEPLVVLEGSPAFYGRLGFEHAVPYGIHIRLPSWAPAEAAQVFRLSSYSPNHRGNVVYPPAFDVVAEHRQTTPPLRRGDEHG